MKLQFAAVLFLLASNAFGLPLNGRVQVTGRKAGSIVTTIVYAESLDSRSAVKPGTFSIAQKNKSFVPHILAIPAGSTVNFPNEDLIFHNVFTLSRPNPFDLG